MNMSATARFHEAFDRDTNRHSNNELILLSGIPGVPDNVPSMNTPWKRLYQEGRATPNNRWPVIHPFGNAYRQPRHFTDGCLATKDGGSLIIDIETLSSPISC